MSRPPQEVTQLLRAWGQGDQRVSDALLPLSYDELHLLAHRYQERERAGQTLQTTALVNEAYLRLADYQSASWQDRAPFPAVSARVMRGILADYARSRRYLKRGGDVERVSLDGAEVRRRRGMWIRCAWMKRCMT